MWLAQAAKVNDDDLSSAEVELALFELAGGSAAKRGNKPRSSRRRLVTGCTVSPRKSRWKSACFSNTVTSMPARASSSAATIPAGPPPAIAQVVD
jgi:hypothetical protein